MPVTVIVFVSIISRSQTTINISAWGSILKSSVDLPWSGTAYVKCNGAKKVLAKSLTPHTVYFPFNFCRWYANTWYMMCSSYLKAFMFVIDEDNLEDIHIDTFKSKIVLDASCISTLGNLWHHSFPTCTTRPCVLVLSNWYSSLPPIWIWRSGLFKHTLYKGSRMDPWRIPFIFLFSFSCTVHVSILSIK